MPVVVAEFYLRIALFITCHKYKHLSAICYYVTTNVLSYNNISGIKIIIEQCFEVLKQTIQHHKKTPICLKEKPNFLMIRIRISTGLI